MLYDFIKIEQESAVPVYRQLHDELREAVLAGQLLPGQKMLSIRAAARELTLSRMTVETAYQQLCMEGYLMSSPQRGYFVARHIHKPPSETTKRKPDSVLDTPRYDFGSRRVDGAHADLRLWQKYMRAVLSQEEVITSYGEAQGESELREALAAYAFEARGVRTTPEQIVIGAGTQPLLTLLCGLLGEQKIPDLRTPLTAGIESPGFPQAEQVFSDFGMTIRHLNRKEPREEFQIGDDIDLYIYLAARTGQDSFQHEMARRNELVAWRTARPERHILEDDYNGELRFLSRPIPALQGMDDGVSFLGSFSKLLLPSVRIAYMVLPESLAEKFRQRAGSYNQTAGKVEQLALAEYIRQGQLEKHLRRLRRLYQKKSQAVEQALNRYLPETVDYELWETELRYLLTINRNVNCGLACNMNAAKLMADSTAINRTTTNQTGANPSAAGLAAAAQCAGVVLAPLGTAADGRPRLMLSFAGIPLEAIDDGIKTLSESWK